MHIRASAQKTGGKSLPAPRALFALSSSFSSERTRWLIYVAGFLLIFAGLDCGYELLRDTPVEGFVLETLTVVPVTAFISLIFPAIHAAANGNVIQSSAGNLVVQLGCDGTDGIFLMLAAVLPFPAPWRWKLSGAGLGVLLMYLLNQGRLAALFVALRFYPDLFDLLHHFVLPTLIIVCGCVFVFFWMDGNARSAS